MSGLGRADFQVLDNGREVAIEVFDASRRPVSLVMLLDTSQSMLGSLKDLRISAAALIDALDPHDAVRISTFSNRLFRSRLSTSSSCSTSSTILTKTRSSTCIEITAPSNGM